MTTATGPASCKMAGSARSRNPCEPSRDPMSDDRRDDPYPDPISVETRPLGRDDLDGASGRWAALRERLAGRAWSEAQLEASLQRTLAHWPGGDVWLFAYGSLIWNPLFPVAEERVAKVHGLHRGFCIRAVAGRGTPERPGLVLGLKRGGQCEGVVLRLAGHHARDELRMIWRREMITGAYVPTWVQARTAHGPVQALVFRADPRNEAYACLDEPAVAATLREAGGVLGSCVDYLRQTRTGLASRGIVDPALERLQRQVDQP